jgi:CubicO group peptidase (beta-lactamase class C family)
MISTNTSLKALAGLPDVATPHQIVRDTVRPIAWRDIDNIAPAGAINSNVQDMAQWLRLQLGSGRIALLINLEGRVEFARSGPAPD